MPHHYVCCDPQPPCPPCEDSCDFATSYDVIGVTFGYTRSISLRDNCVECYDPGVLGIFGELSINISGVQFGNITVTRVGTPGVTPCCYQGSGTATITYTVEHTEIGFCCGFVNTPAYTFVVNNNWSGTVDVPICITTICHQLPMSTCTGKDPYPTKWVHTLYVCGFPLAATRNAVGENPGPPYCPDVNPFSEVELGSLWVTGARFQWISDLVDPSTIDENEALSTGCGGETVACAFPGGSQCNDVVASAVPGDPFNVYTVDDDWDPGDEPEPCDPVDIAARLVEWPCDDENDLGCSNCASWTVHCGCWRIDSGLTHSFWQYL